MRPTWSVFAAAVVTNGRNERASCVHLYKGEFFKTKFFLKKEGYALCGLRATYMLPPRGCCCSWLGRRRTDLAPVMRAECEREAGRRPPPARRFDDGVPASVGVDAADAAVVAALVVAATESMASMDEKLGAQIDAERPFWRAARYMSSMSLVMSMSGGPAGLRSGSVRPGTARRSPARPDWARLARLGLAVGSGSRAERSGAAG